MKLTGKKRIVILGTCGSGKSTLAKKLSHELKLPHVELDALAWNPNWEMASDELFRKRVQEALEQDAWIVDGNYSVARDLIWPRAEVAIWLDYPLSILVRRLLKRTAKNCARNQELWPGCRESIWMQLFTRNSIFVWLFKNYWKKKRTFPDALAAHPHLTVYHVRHPRELKFTF